MRLVFCDVPRAEPGLFSGSIPSHVRTYLCTWESPLAKLMYWAYGVSQIVSLIPDISMELLKRYQSIFLL